MEGTWNEENFIAVNEAVIICVRVIGVGKEVVLACNHFFTVFQPIIVGVEHTGAGEVSNAFPREASKGFGLVAKSIAVSVRVGCV